MVGTAKGVMVDWEVLEAGGMDWVGKEEEGRGLEDQGEWVVEVTVGAVVGKEAKGQVVMGEEEVAAEVGLEKAEWEEVALVEEGQEGWDGAARVAQGQGGVVVVKAVKAEVVMAMAEWAGVRAKVAQVKVVRGKVVDELS